MVYWDAPSGNDSPIILYRVQWRGLDEAFTEEREEIADAGDRSKEIPGLASDTPYLVRVAAQNEHGLGDWAESEGTTLAEGVPDPPMLRVTPFEGGMDLSWDKPWDGGWPIEEYIVEWEDPNGRIVVERYRADSSGAEIHGLVGGGKYVVRVAAENQNGPGGWARATATVPDTPTTTSSTTTSSTTTSSTTTSTTISIVPPQPPSTPVVQEHYRGLVVSWDEPIDDGGSAIAGYSVQLSSGSEVVDSGPLSPDKRKAEFTGLDSGKTYKVQLFAVNKAGAMSEPAVTGGTALYRVAYVSNQEGRDAIYYADVRESDGTLELVGSGEPVTGDDIEEREGSPGWSPDGSWIAFHRRTSEDTHNQIFVRNIDSGDEHQLLCGGENGWSPSWSPDGSYIAFSRSSGGENDIWSLDVQTGEQESLKDQGGANDRRPKWSPDGKHIVYARGEPPPHDTRDVRVLHRRSETDNVDQILWIGGDYSAPDWSWASNHSKLAYAFRSSDSEYRHIYVADWRVQNSDTSDPDLTLSNKDQITDGRHKDDEPSWSPDGRWIAFTREDDGRKGIYVANSSDGEPRPLLAFPGDYWAPSWAPSGDVTVDPTFDWLQC